MDKTILTPIIINAHFEIIKMLGEMGMLWWVSSTVMCIGILKSAWVFKVSKNSHLPLAIIWAVTLFLGSIMIFGFSCAYAITVLESEYLHIVGPVLSQSIPGTDIFIMVSRGFIIGTSSFFLACVCWIYIMSYKIEQSAFLPED